MKLEPFYLKLFNIAFIVIKLSIKEILKQYIWKNYKFHDFFGFKKSNKNTKLITGHPKVISLYCNAIK